VHVEYKLRDHFVTRQECKVTWANWLLVCWTQSTSLHTEQHINWLT